jgi:hypothetical protein
MLLLSSLEGSNPIPKIELLLLQCNLIIMENYPRLEGWSVLASSAVP